MYGTIERLAVLHVSSSHLPLKTAFRDTLMLFVIIVFYQSKFSGLFFFKVDFILNNAYCTK